jgi:hypothetical protein
MPLTLRPTGLVSPVYGHLQDWTIFEDGKPVGRIYEDVSERVVGQPLTGARDLKGFGRILRLWPNQLQRSGLRPGQ